MIAATHLLQRVVRGHLGRERMARVKIEKAVRVYAAITIQRVYRGSRVLHWRDLCLNVIAAFVLDRQYLERKDRIAASRLRYKQYIESFRHDSASEDEGEDPEPEGSTWVKMQDYKKKRDYWMNMVTGEITYIEPMGTLVKEKSLMNKRVRVFWVAQGEWYTGTVTRFHKRKHRYGRPFPFPCSSSVRFFMLLHKYCLYYIPVDTVYTHIHTLTTLRTYYIRAMREPNPSLPSPLQPNLYCDCRHRVEYDDGDHEWIDMDKELDRVQVLLADGSWVMVRTSILLRPRSIATLMRLFCSRTTLHRVLYCTVFHVPEPRDVE
jgi:hypothetical protein